MRALLIALWLAVVAGALYLFFFQRELLQNRLQDSMSSSILVGSVVYLFFGCIRGFTLIPSTTLVVTAIPFFPPALLFGLTITGILISSASIYLFSEALHLDETLTRKYGRRVGALTMALQKYELPVIIGWSFFPLAPTDLICYVCGVLRVDFRKCLLGVGIGEGAICGVYIFLGNLALRLWSSV
jgi:uncharacterized membrane protein YdjX (TVP38/TMEM64 family)